MWLHGNQVTWLDPVKKLYEGCPSLGREHYGI